MNGLRWQCLRGCCAVRLGWFSSAAAERMAGDSRDMLMALLHAPEAVLPAEHKCDSLPDVPEDTLCYYYGCENSA